MKTRRRPDTNLRTWCAQHGHDGEADLLMVRMCEELGSFDGTVPVDLEVLASVQGVHSIDVVDMPQAGCIYADGGRFGIHLRAADPAPRRRFTLAHEICHTFFEITRKRGVTDAEVGRYTEKEPLEYLCDLGAAELLLPREPFGARCPDNPGFDDVAALARLFDASLEATASRIVGLGLGPRQLVVLEPGLTVDQKRSLKRAAVQPSFVGLEAPAPEPRLRVSWATGGERFVPPNKSVDDRAALRRCVERGRC